MTSRKPRHGAHVRERTARTSPITSGAHPGKMVEATHEKRQLTGAGRLTERCRLYRAYPPTDSRPRGSFVEVWDSVEDPFERKGPLPAGEIFFTMAHHDSQVVRRAVDKYCQENNIVTAPSWGYKGM